MRNTYVIITFVVLLLCCKQKSDFGSRSAAKISSKSLSKAIVGVTGGAKEKACLLPSPSPPPPTDKIQPGERGPDDPSTDEVKPGHTQPDAPPVETPSQSVVEAEKREAYSQLSKKLDELKKLYEYVEPGTLSLSDAFKSKFGREPYYYKNKYVYASLGGKKDSIVNFKKIVVDIHKDMDMSSRVFDNGSPYWSLWNIGENYFGDVIEFFYRPPSFLGILQDVQDVQTLRDLVSDVEELGTLWSYIVKKLQNEVDEIAKWCDKYLEIKDKLCKQAEIKEYRVAVRNASQTIIIAAAFSVDRFTDPPKKGCIGDLCDAVYNFFTLKGKIVNKVRELLKVINKW
ncbi:hypothetical protein [Borrelia persica]|uniref:hypothetical protein n=1 Tax=Borrelia persica TaxID=44448 RepID=UPI000466A69A|nr:hypothetical protein [Borrelia persica]